MSAKIYVLPSGARNHQLVMARRQDVLARPDVQEQLAECERLLTAHHASRLLAKTSEMPRHVRTRQLD